MSKRLKQAFTLIELLVVIAIIGILSGLIVVSMGGMTNKATIAKAQVFSNSLRNSLMLNLISEWKFEGPTAVGQTATSDDVKDTWKGNNGTIGGNPKVKGDNDCIYGKCLSFNGSTDYVSVNATSLYSSLTQMVWVKTKDVTTVRQYIFTNQKNPPDTGYNTYMQRQGFHLSNDDVQVQYWTGSGSALLQELDIIKNDIWTNIVWTAGSNGGKLYINGSLVDSIATAPSTSIIPNQSLIGRRSDANGEDYFNGLIDDLRVFDIVMPAFQIKEQYYAGLNKLLSKGEVKIEEYIQRVAELEIKTARE